MASQQVDMILKLKPAMPCSAREGCPNAATLAFVSRQDGRTYSLESMCAICAAECERGELLRAAYEKLRACRFLTRRT